MKVWSYFSLLGAQIWAQKWSKSRDLKVDDHPKFFKIGGLKKKLSKWQFLDFWQNPTQKFLTPAGDSFFYPRTDPNFEPPLETSDRQGHFLGSSSLELGRRLPRPSRKKGPIGPYRALTRKNDSAGRAFWEGVFLTEFLRPPKVSNLCSPHNTGQFFYL